MHNFTIFTTTYNRYKYLERLYESLKDQTEKDFVWLIVDDGSTDETASLIKSFINEGTLDIEYVYKPNGGKHTAMKMGFEMTKTPYMVEIDDDDELLPHAIEVFFKEWEAIEKECKFDIAEIRALSMNDKGEVSGNYDPSVHIGKLDSNYIEMDWVQKRHFENITSWKMSLIQKVKIFDDQDKWLYSKVKLISESVFWNRVARQYNTRYIFEPLRLYHSDAGDSITLSSFSRQKCYNYVFSILIILNELGNLVWKNKRQLLKYLAEYLSCGIAVGISKHTLLYQLRGWRQKCLCCLLLFPSILYSIRLKRNFS